MMKNKAQKTRPWSARAAALFTSSALLAFSSSVFAEQVFTDNVAVQTTVTPQLALRQTVPGAAYEWRIALLGSTLAFTETLTGATPVFIGTGAPTGSLVVNNIGALGLGITPAQVIHAATDNSPTIRLEQEAGSFPAQIWDVATNEFGFAIVDRTASTVPIIAVAGAPDNSVSISSNGNTGLGTGNPAGKLHVFSAGNQLSIFQSSDNMAVQFRLQTNSTNRRFVALNAAGTQQSQLVFGDNGAFDFLGATAADVRMRFLANGNVGIGTSTPDQKLSVNGNASKPGGGSWATFSDERLKNIKGKFTSGLEEVLKLEPIRYEYKADNAEGIVSEGEHIGFGAQEVQKIIPEAVTENSDGYLMVDNDPILWTMLNAIKEQNAQMTAQSKEIAHLKKQNKELAQLKEQNLQIVERLERLQAQVVLQAATKTPDRAKVADRDR